MPSSCIVRSISSTSAGRKVSRTGRQLILVRRSSLQILDDSELLLIIRLRTLGSGMPTEPNCLEGAGIRFMYSIDRDCRESWQGSAAGGRRGRTGIRWSLQACSRIGVYVFGDNSREINSSTNAKVTGKCPWEELVARGAILKYPKSRDPVLPGMPLGSHL